MMSAACPRVLIMAGGTGGHVFPALAVAETLRDRGWAVDWVGTAHGLEARVVPERQFTLHRLSVRGLRGKGLLTRIGSLLRLVLALFESMLLVLRLRPNVVLGMGGYAAGPAGVAAAVLRYPLVIHEQNAVIGTTNRWLAPLARRVLCGLPGGVGAGVDAQWVGNPVRREFLAPAGQNESVEKRFPLRFDAARPLRLLVVGGSLGARPLNETIPAALQSLSAGMRERITVCHQCGDRHFDATRALYGSVAGAGVDVVPFLEDMAAAYRDADLVICRAGALTISELAISGAPAILVPLPHAIDDHQSRNAHTLSDVGGAILLPQSEMTVERLGQLIVECLEDPGRLQTLSKHARTQAAPEATASVVRVLEEVANVR